MSKRKATDRRKTRMTYALGLVLVASLVAFLFIWRQAPSARAPAGAVRNTGGSSIHAIGILDAVRFDTTGWKVEVAESVGDRLMWTDAEGAALSVDLVDGPAPADMPPLNDPTATRAYCRRLAEGDRRGLVSADVIKLREASALTLIYKREQLPAYAYTGMMIIPGEHRHFIIVIAATEQGVTGVRDAIVTAQMLEAGTLDPTKVDGSGRVHGWFRDPYDSSFDAVTITSVADDEKYDSLVPSHPLLKVRRAVRGIINTIRFAPLDTIK